MRRREVSGLFNLGTGRARTWLELMEALYSSVGSELSVDWVDTPAATRGSYQYFTQAQMGRLRAVGYDRPFTEIEEGVADYVERYLARSDPYR
jgi:ADP-L-glycero-D-manno-heptose 6-epimerase